MRNVAPRQTPRSSGVRAGPKLTPKLSASDMSSLPKPLHCLAIWPTSWAFFSIRNVHGRSSGPTTSGERLAAGALERVAAPQQAEALLHGADDHARAVVDLRARKEEPPRAPDREGDLSLAVAELDRKRPLVLEEPAREERERPVAGLTGGQDGRAVGTVDHVLVSRLPTGKRFAPLPTLTDGERLRAG